MTLWSGGRVRLLTKGIHKCSDASALRRLGMLPADRNFAGLPLVQSCQNACSGIAIVPIIPSCRAARRSS